MEDKMAPKSAPEMASLERPQMPKSALFSLCFRTKRSVAGTPKGSQKGIPKGSQKGARNEAKKGAEAGIGLNEIIVVNL